MASLEQNEDISHFLYINSTTAPTCILFMCIVIMIVFTTTKPIAIPRPVVWGTEALITLLSMVVTFVIWFLVRRNTRKFLIETQRRDVTLNIKLVFFWVFGMANIFHSALLMAADIDCLLKDEHQAYLIGYQLSILTHLIEIFFCVGQIGFLNLYGQYCFRPSSLINNGISLMIIAHLLRWFRMFFDPIVSARNLIPSNVLQPDNCIRSSNITAIRKDLESHVNPLITEYSLLSVAIAVRMFVNIYNDNMDTTFSEQDTITEETTNKRGDKKATSNEELISLEIPSTHKSAFAGRNNRVQLSLAFLIAFIFTFLGIVKSAELYRVVSSIFEMGVIALLCFAKWKFRSQFIVISQRESMSSKYQIILICITSGSIAFQTFEGIAGLLNAEDVACFILFFNKLLQMASIIIQSEFILKMKNISFMPRHTEVKHSTCRVSQVFLCIFVINITRWLIDSVFIGQDKNTSVIQRQFYGDTYWKTVVHTLFPVHVFYRFLSAIEMYELHKNTFLKP